MGEYFDKVTAAAQPDASENIADRCAAAAERTSERELTAFAGREAAAAAVTLVLCVLLVFEGIWGGFRAGFTVCCISLLAAMGAFLGRERAGRDRYCRFCGAAAFALALVFTVTSDPSIRFFSVVAMAFAAAVWLMGLSGNKMPEDETGPVIYALRAVGIALGNIPRSVSSMLNAGGKRTGTILKGALGAACAVPVLFIVVPLLMRSDAAFEGMVSGALSRFTDVRTFVLQTVLALFIWLSAVSFTMCAGSAKERKASGKEKKGADTVFFAAFLSLLSVCYLCYLFSQLAYFFSAFSGLLPEGYDYSYAEYARRGFFEITVTAGVNTAVMFAVIVLSRKKDGQVPAVLKALGLFICCFTLVLVVTAVSKMVMYINVYGMTLLRIETGAFMLFICAVFIAITARLFTQRVRVLKFAVAAAACTLIVLGVGNAAAFTARYNYNAYKSGRLESVDVDHMRELGDEGVPFLVKLAQGDDPAVRAHARRELYGAFLEYYSWTWEGDDPEHMERRYGRLTEFGLSRSAAYRGMEEFLSCEPGFLKDEALLLRDEAERYDMEYIY